MFCNSPQFPCMPNIVLHDMSFPGGCFESTDFQCRLFWSNSYINNNSSIIISHLDIRHGNTCAELEFPSPISSVIKRCQICKSASTAVSKKVICYIQIVYEKRSLNVSKRSEQLSFPTYVSILEKLASPRVNCFAMGENPFRIIRNGGKRRECTGINGGDELEREMSWRGDELEGR
ncbi:hypothetical protein Tsp_03216 [Trichinella spiralis]|uniref:hypothetical protein n=1 Tax=Trichinella spiralis TaxID=6334 RepID=UPI0001EFC1AB|nr:hypothetical protein Tsp_03216 [Trichinella spiralis]